MKGDQCWLGVAALIGEHGEHDVTSALAGYCGAATVANLLAAHYGRLSSEATAAGKPIAAARFAAVASVYDEARCSIKTINLRTARGEVA